MGKRRWQHRLKRPVKRALPEVVIVLDCESQWDEDGPPATRQTHRFRLAVTATMRRRVDGTYQTVVHIHDTPESVWEQVRDCLRWRKSTWVVAHNLKVDLTLSGFWKMVERREFVPSKIVIDEIPFFIQGRLHGRGLRLVDTLNYWPCSVEELGQSLGLAKIPLPANDAPREDWLRRCLRDVEILAGSMERLLRGWAEEDLGPFALTAAGLAWNAFRYKFMTAVPQVHADERVLALERHSYYGGCSHCFFTGSTRGRFYQLDVNGLYPWVMWSENYPTQLTGTNPDPTVEDLRRVIDRDQVAADVTICSPFEPFPVRHNGRVLFATGRYRTALCGAELELAVQLGCVEKCHFYATYSHAPLFTSYVKHFVERKSAARLARDRPREEFYSLLLKSLSGKFGQRSPQWEVVKAFKATHPFGGVFERLGGDEKRSWVRVFGFKAERLVARLEWVDSVPAISGFITAAGRHYMRMLRNIVEEHNLYYQGVDSLIVDEEGFVRLNEFGLVADTDPGALKVQVRGDRLSVEAVGRYRVGDVVKCAGVPRSAQVAGTQATAWAWPELDEILRPDHEIDTFTLHSRRFQFPLTLTDQAPPEGRRHPWPVVSQSEEQMAKADLLKFDYANT